LNEIDQSIHFLINLKNQSQLMKKILFNTLLFHLFLMLLAGQTKAQSCKDVIGYYYSPTSTQLPPDNIDYDKYTEIHYAFFKPGASGDNTNGNPGTSVTPDGTVTPYGQSSTNATTTLNSLKSNITNYQNQTGKKIKLMITIGGYSTNAVLAARFYWYSKNLTSPTTTTFADNCAALLTTHNLDGIDIDWEGEATACDYTSYRQLIQFIKNRMLLLTNGAAYSLQSTVGPYQAINRIGLAEMKNVSGYVDRINLMTFDFNGAPSAPGPNTPMSGNFGGQNDIPYYFNQLTTGTYAISSSKINMGLAFYGQSFHSASSTYSKLLPDETYRGIKAELTTNAASWIITSNYGNAVATHTNGLDYIYYDDVASMNTKTSYVINNSLAGVFIWNIAGDYPATTTSHGAGNNFNNDVTDLATAVRNAFDNAGRPGTPSGISSICANAANSTFTVGAVSGVTSYVWSITPSSAGTITGTSTSAVVDWTNTGGSPVNVFISVKGVANCQSAESFPKAVTLNQLPTAPFVVGPNFYCLNPPNQLYSFTNVTPGASYVWSNNNTTVASFYSGNTGTTTTLDFSNTATGDLTLSAQGSNSCGTGAIGSINISIASSIPATPSTPSGLTTVCNNGATTSYSLAPPAANVKIWDVTPSTAVNSSTVTLYGGLTIDWSDTYSGPVYIKGQLHNGCGTSAYSPICTVNVTGACRMGSPDPEPSSSEGMQIGIYPNPTDNNVHLVVRNSESGKVRLEVLDMKGGLVYKNEEVSTLSEFTFGTELTPGIYLVKVSYDEQQKILKFVKQ
jgi:GH18 family chitinase